MEILHKKATYHDLLEIDIPEGSTDIYELIKGEIVKRSSPNTPHQRTSAALFLQIGMYNLQKKIGQLFHAPYDVYFDEDNAGIQPDIIFVSNERNFIIRENNGVVGAPDLIIEILSKGTTSKDRGDKKDIYEQFAVREYWIADPQNHSIEVYRMEHNRYHLYSFAQEEGFIKSEVFPDLVLDMKAVFG
jgi:Uma2 family endonuclease